VLVDALFYADDGMIAGENQKLRDLFMNKFAAVCLKMSTEETEAMIMEGGEVLHLIAQDVYHY
jgi:hypothetical protein